MPPRADERAAGAAPATPPGLIGRTLAHFEVLEHLGGGGMGVVYKARDQKLGRPVALKLLPPQLSGDSNAISRFLQEARAISALDHRAICTLHAIEHAEDGQLFLVMPYYDGETLARRIDRGPLGITEVVTIAFEIGLGLARAHECGIVHRDVKPANVMLTARREVKLLDFGLAKLAGGGQPTELGTVVGTAAYMAPEQATGHAVDQRTDIWALGVVIFEMLTGQLPFRGSGSMAVLRAIINDAPAPVEELRPETPAGLVRILRKALAKDPAARFQTMRELLSALELELPQGSRPSATGGFIAPPELAKPSLLVLPFRDLSPDRAAGHVADGLTDELITYLSGIEGLRVISRASAISAQGAGKDPLATARELEVRYLLEGTVRSQADQLRVAVRLLDLDGAVLWAERFGGSLADLFSIEETIARTIVATLEVRLSERENLRLGEQAITDVHAYEHYLKARHEYLRYTADGLERALVFLEQALAVAPDNLQLLAALGMVHYQYLNAGVSQDPSHLTELGTCVERMLTLSAHSAPAHRLRGLQQMIAGRTEEAVAALEHAVALDPNDVETLAWLSSVLCVAGRPAAALPLLDRVISQDPLTPMYRGVQGYARLLAGQPDAAAAALGDALRLEPNNPMMRLLHGVALSWANRPRDARESWEIAWRDQPGNLFATLALCFARAVTGEHEAAAALLSPEIELVASSDPQYAWHLAELHTMLGDHARAIDCLAQAIEQGQMNYPLLAEGDPWLAPLRTRPRFQEILARLRPRWQALVR